MTHNYKISASGVRLICSFEGFRDKAYQDDAKIWTIGYGTTAGVQAGDRITVTEAQRRLEEHVNRDLTYLAGWASKYLIATQLNQREVDALASWIYNLGFSAFENSTLQARLIKYLNSSSVDEMASALNEVKIQWTRWTKININGVMTHSTGLEKRRYEELRLFLLGAVERMDALRNATLLDAPAPDSIKAQLLEIKSQIEKLIETM